MVSRNKNQFEQEIAWLLNDKYGGISLSEAKGRTLAAIEKDIALIKAGEPIDYVIGFSRFLDCKIDLSKKPLIPRTETEYWVEKAITEMEVRKLKLNFKKIEVKLQLECLDIFAGSGCIGVALLKNVEHAHVDFAEIDRRLIDQIKKNCEINNIAESRYNVIKSNIFAEVVSKYDYIFANPPYCAIKSIKRVQKSVLQYEPKSAVFGGDDGLAYIRPFIAQAKNFLKPGGRIYCEFDPAQRGSVERMAKQAGYSSCEFFTDQFGRWRYFVIQ
ncbi:MAG: HemK family protein methyltransferase [Candidatus Spechtbacteria bacterium]|nr:HemK family protein methyltransferase [Candidatus Spechtbacteria bacterium]